MNEQQQRLIKSITHAFDFANVYTHPSYSTTPHYTAVVHIGGELQQKLKALQEEYLSYDDSLQTVAPELLHVSLGKGAIEDGHERLQAITERFLKQRHVTLCAGLTAVDAAGALGVVFWPKDSCLLEYRKEVAEAYGKSFTPDTRSQFGWSTLARFTKVPSHDLIRYVQNNAFMELGEATLDNATIYNPHRRDLQGSEVVARI